MSGIQDDRRHAFELISQLEPLVTALSQLAQIADVFVSGVSVHELAPVLSAVASFADDAGEAALAADATADRIISERGGFQLWVQRTVSLAMVLENDDTGTDWGMRLGPGGEAL